MRLFGRWKPTGRQITDIMQLRDGQQVQAIAFYKDKRIRKKLRKAHISIKKNEYFPYAKVFLIGPHGFITILGYQPRDVKFNYMDSSKIFAVNLIKENQSMANKLMAMVRLNKNQRKLSKAGIYDENGNLTTDGQEVLLNLIAKEYEPKLVELVKDWKEDKKKKSDEDDD